jgi:hypothetical protein
MCAIVRIIRSLAPTRESSHISAASMKLIPWSQAYDSCSCASCSVFCSPHVIVPRQHSAHVGPGRQIDRIGCVHVLKDVSRPMKRDKIDTCQSEDKDTRSSGMSAIRCLVHPYGCVEQLEARLVQQSSSQMRHCDAYDKWLGECTVSNSRRWYVNA